MLKLTREGNPDVATTGNLVKGYLEDIDDLFRHEETVSRHYGGSITTEDEGLEGQKEDKYWMVRSLRSLSTRHHPGRPSFRKQLRWAIQGETRFKRLIENISADVDNLERIFPAVTLSQMRQDDVREISRQPDANSTDVELLTRSATLVDEKLSVLLQARVCHEWTGNVAEDKARIF